MATGFISDSDMAALDAAQGGTAPIPPPSFISDEDMANLQGGSSPQPNQDYLKSQLLGGAAGLLQGGAGLADLVYKGGQALQGNIQGISENPLTDKLNQYLGSQGLANIEDQAPDTLAHHIGAMVPAVASMGEGLIPTLVKSALGGAGSSAGSDIGSGIDEAQGTHLYKPSLDALGSFLAMSAPGAASNGISSLIGPQNAESALAKVGASAPVVQRAAIQGIMSDDALAEGVTKASTGDTVKSAVTDLFNDTDNATKAAWNAVPKDTQIPTNSLQDAINKSYDSIYTDGTKAPHKEIQNILDYVDNALQPSKQVTSSLVDASGSPIVTAPSVQPSSMSMEELQNLRARIGKLGTNLYNSDASQPADLRFASALPNIFEDYLSNAPNDAGDAWSKAVAATKAQKSMFGSGIGRAILNDSTNSSNIAQKVMSSPESAQDFMSLIGDNEDARKAIVNQVGSDLQGLKPTQQLSYLNNKDSQLQTILNDDEYSGLQSAKDSLAKGNNQGYFQKLAEQAGASKPPSSLTQHLGTRALELGSAAISAAHPAIGIPAFIASTGIDFLRGRSGSLLADVMTNAMSDPDTLKKAITLAGQRSAPSLIKNALPAVMNAAISNQSPGVSISPQVSARTQQTISPQIQSSSIPSSYNSALVSALTQQKSSGQTVIPKFFDKSSFVDNALNRAEAKMNGDTPTAPIVINADRVDPTHAPTMAAISQAVIGQESGGKANALSNKGAQGLMQLEPATGKELFTRYANILPDTASPTKYNPNNPDQNKILGTMYLKELLTKYNGDLPLALTSYNQGMGRVDNLLKIHDGTSLDDIKKYLGPVGKVYAQSVLNRLKNIDGVQTV